MAEFVLGFHVGEELVEDDLIVFVFGCLCPDEIGNVSRELLFGAICWYDVVEGIVNLPQFHGRVFIKALVFHEGEDSFKHFDKIYKI